MINVTKSYLPPMEDYVSYLRTIWESGWLTNNGQLVQRLERELTQRLGVDNLLYVSNGTIALQLAIQALGLTGEVITTPFSYVATSNAVLWERCTPKFVDISPVDLCIDVEQIEDAITERTEAILAVHVYGLPCRVREIECIARKHGLKVIYDAAHAFGVTVDGIPIGRFGDISTFSFHSTKLFHTVEGGGIACSEPELAEKLRLMRSFGHRQDDYVLCGINGKNSEFHAAMGLALLPKVEEFIERRRFLSELYDRLLAGLPILRPSTLVGNIQYNYAYYPVLFRSESELRKVMAMLAEHEVIPRRYFYPALNRLPFIQGDRCPIAEDVVRRVLCLPLYFELADGDVDKISNLVAQALSKKLHGASSDRGEPLAAGEVPTRKRY